MAFKHTELFGGAITANIPAGFADVSTIRQVPDHQEVYLEANGFTSLTIDLTERVTQFPSDKEALQYHFHDIITEGDTAEISSISENIQLPKFPPSTPTLSLTATTSPAPSTPNTTRRPHTATYTDIHFTLIRLAEQNTDLIITLNIPHIPSETIEKQENNNTTGDEEEVVAKQKIEREKQMTEVWKGIVESLEVRDWSLFGGE